LKAKIVHSFWQKTDTSRSIVLLKEYWQAKCCLKHCKL